ncbi:MAG: hypothetical protein R3A48_26070 [Polyangiales bacterium]
MVRYVKRRPGRDDVDALDVAAAVVKAPRELERGLVGLGAAVAEVHPVEARAPRELRGELDLPVGVVVVRDVPEARDLLGDGLHQRRVRVAEHAHRDARVEVEVAAAVGVPEVAALAAGHHQRRLLVVSEEVATGQVEELVRR